MMKKTLVAGITFYFCWRLLLPEIWIDNFASFLNIKSNHLDHKIDVVLTVMLFTWLLVLFVMLTYRTWYRIIRTSVCGEEKQ